LGKPVSGILYFLTFGFFGNHFSHAHPPLEVQLLKVCRDQQGATLSDCVIASERSADEVRAKVQELCLEELLVVANRETDGAVIYRAV